MDMEVRADNTPFENNISAVNTSSEEEMSEEEVLLFSLDRDQTKQAMHALLFVSDKP